LIKVNALAFLFIIQFLLIFFGLTIFLFIKYRKLTIKEVITRGEISRLKSEIEGQTKENILLLRWRDMFIDLREKFELIKNNNIKLKETINLLIPEAQRTKEYEQLLADIESNNKELDMCIGTLQKENENLNQRVKSFTVEMDELTHKLEHSVSEDKYQSLAAEKNLEIKKLEEALKEQVRRYENLEKNYVWLEKEYRALYRNISEN